MSVNWLNSWGFLFAAVMLFSCTNNHDEVINVRADFTKSAIQNSIVQIDYLIEEANKENKIPRTTNDEGEILWCKEGWDWTEGFFPGICWQVYNITNNEKYAETAKHFQKQYANHRFLKLTHDMGFVFYNSYGKAFESTGDSTYLNVLIDAGNTLIERYNDTIGCLQSWNVSGLTEGNWIKRRGWEFPVIIDNMMNLEMLFELTILTGDSTYWTIAVNHANTTLKNHFRKNHSSYHVIDYSKKTGNVKNRETVQGYAHESAWARGQAWGLYGFTMAYRYTKNQQYLRQAENIASFIINHKNLPKDKVSYWDFNAPKIPNEPRDVSAATIMASALLELDSYSENDYYPVAKDILFNLSTPKYKADTSANEHFILNHSVGSIPHESDIDVPIIYADYYYLESLLRVRLLTINVSKSDD